MSEKYLSFTRLFFPAFFLILSSVYADGIIDLKQAPDNFVFLSDIDPTIIESPRYYSAQNFLGRRIKGYESPRITVTREAAVALKKAHDELKKLGYRLVVYDAYRPQRAVNEFVEWSKDIKDQISKELYYPTVNKADVFKSGYVAEKSGHSRGSTFDLTIIPLNQPIKEVVVTKRKLKNGEEIPFLDDGTIDMGSGFDLFHEVSHHGTSLISTAQTQSRELLRGVMKKNGFKDYPEEWWHYTLENEPYTDTYFDFITIK